ncbi:hypothetical protein PK35_02805 [Tamlana nanhaiensis]|uniref:XshC-Cox1-family protein n=1 Tax=Neotamlana nanhaiensis TaxID=1382798 RepID=A0A0D7WAD0_9FLAO|nr:XdhC/CoxI family protein [Tamlana nanhaiensis]KJD34707.1 hypothetical protein PK35_02805 [Tamlana nanhaiensis]
MTHEFKQILETAYQNRHLKHVLATVVALNGSSYRKPGVQMLISEDETMTGAVSGGCVEKEVLFQAQSVFKTGLPKVMDYDGSYRLGCEGVLYILLEPFLVSETDYHNIQSELQLRRTLEFTAYFEEEVTTNSSFGSTLTLSNKNLISFRSGFKPLSQTETFKINFPALSQLIIIGTEHDAVSLCTSANLLGWEITVVGSPRDPKPIERFPGAKTMLYLDPSSNYDFTCDEHTAVILMNHNYARDLNFILTLQHQKFYYLGVLGSAKRREKLMNALIEYNPDINTSFLDRIYSPAGINIGAITPQEIAVSILSEIIAVKRHKEVPSLREHMGSIHAK